MQNCSDYLIHLVRCAIHNITPSEIPDGVIFDSVYKLAVRHDIVNLAYCSIKMLENKPESDLMKKWDALHNEGIIRDLNQKFARDELTEALETAGIHNTEVQGTVIKPLYPLPEYRTMSDIDIIVEPEKLSRVYSILEELGYKCSYFRDYDINAERKPNINVEIHTSFFAVDSDFCGVLGDPFADKSEGSYHVTMNRDTVYLYNILHTAKHYFFAGCGIRRILDIYFLNREYADVATKPGTRALFTALGIADFVRDASELAECWFGEKERNPRTELCEMADIIIGAGVHGTGRRKLMNQLEKNAKKGTNVNFYVLRRVFPEKWKMYQRYPVLKRYPVLWPFCWSHRLFYALIKKRSAIRIEIDTIRDAFSHRKNKKDQ